MKYLSLSELILFPLRLVGISLACMLSLNSMAFAADVTAAPAAFNVFGLSVTDLMTYAAAFIGAASTLAAALPTPSEGSVWWYLRKLLDWAAMNVGNAKNAAKA